MKSAHRQQSLSLYRVFDSTRVSQFAVGSRQQCRRVQTNVTARVHRSQEFAGHASTLREVEQLTDHGPQR